MNKIESPLTVEQLTMMHAVNFAYFDKLWRSGEENERYISADPFTDQEKQDYSNEGRFPYSVPMIPHKINTIVASEKDSRTTFKIEAVSDPMDEPKAELATIRLKNIEQKTGLKYIESDVFLSGVGVKYGVIALRIEQDDAGNNVIVFDEVDYKDFIWDCNARKYEKDDAVFMAEMKRVYRFQLDIDYPDIDKQYSGQVDLWANGRQWAEYFVTTSAKRDDLDVITKFTHYQKVMRDYYCVFFKGEKVAEERSKKDAEDILKMLKLPSLVQGLPEPPAFIEKAPKPRMDKYVFTYTDILEYEETELDFFPYTIYQAFQFKDKIWCMTDVLKSPQIFLDRTIAQIDYSFGKDVKDGFEVVVPKLADGITAEEAVRRAKNGEGVPVLASGSISWIQRNSIDPQWLSIYEVMLSLAEDVSGGRSFSGLQDSAGESGVAIKQKLIQGEKIASLFIDNKFRMKRDLGKKALNMLALFDTAPYAMKVLGGALTPEMLQLLMMQNIYKPSEITQGVGYAKMNQPGNPLSSMEWLKDRDFELQVVEEQLSESQRQMKYQMYLMAEQRDQSLLMSPTWRRLKLEVMDIPYSDRQKILAEFEQQMMEQKQAEQEMKQTEADNASRDDKKFLISEIGKQKQKENVSKK